ncbi:MAG: MBL fold metallo-hydrolase [Pseudomonadota bacterium]
MPRRAFQCPYGPFLFGVLAPLIAAYAQQDFSQVEIDARAVAGSVYMLTGAGGNIGVSAGEEGILIVDDQYAPLADKIRKALSDIAGPDAPVRFVLNTHYHGDHTGGNEAFQQQHGATVIAHDNVRERLASGGTAGNRAGIAFEFPASPSAALPVVTFHERVVIHINGEQVRASHIAHGHTDGDAVVYFAEANVVHMGDNFVTYGFPFIDLASGGSIDGMIETTEHVLATLPDDVKVIPGHGNLSTPDDLRAFLSMLHGARAAVVTAIDAGLTPDQMKAQGILSPWQEWDRGFIKADGFIDTLYNDLTTETEDHGHH